MIGGTVEVDALDAGLGVGAVEVAQFTVTCWPPVGVDHQIAVLRGAVVVVLGVQSASVMTGRSVSGSIGGRRQDRDAIRRATAGRANGFIDDVVAVAEG